MTFQPTDFKTGELIHLRTAYNYDMNAASDETAINCPPEDNLTQQQFKEDSDINEIVRRFGITGRLPDNYEPPQSGDFTGITDFQSAMNAVTEAQANFLLVPAEIRARFNNDPQRFMAFIDDDRNRDEADKLGLLKKKPELTRDGHTAPLRVVVESTPPILGDNGAKQ